MRWACVQLLGVHTSPGHHCAAKQAKQPVAAVTRQAREREAALTAAVAAKRAEAERAAGEWSSLPAELAPVRPSCAPPNP